MTSYVLLPGPSKLRGVGPTREPAESCVPMTITVSYARHHGTPNPFLMIPDKLKVGEDWKIVSGIILPVALAPARKGEFPWKAAMSLGECIQSTGARS